MKVKLIRFDENALDLLIGTKAARMRGKSPSEMHEEEKYEHFQYMLSTIKSPFEFSDYIFEIEGVSRNFLQQFVRTRTGAYQVETQRAIDLSGTEVIMPEAFKGKPDLEAEFWDAVADAQAAYENLISLGSELQDARAIMPSNTATKLMAKFNLRTLSDMAKNRLCTRTAGEYQNVFRLMRQEVLAVHPWAEPLLQVACVATGQCAFPRHGKEHCKFFQPWMELEERKEELRKVFWATEVTTNNPIAKDGVSHG